MTEPTAGPRGTILVVGGGIAGLTAAIEAAEAGNEVFLVEKSARNRSHVDGGRYLIQLDRIFIKHGFPALVAIVVAQIDRGRSRHHRR